MLENHVPSLELCKKWKEIGGRQDTIFYYVKTISLKYKLVTEEDLKGYRTMRRVGEWYAAPLASEMMEWRREKDAVIDTYIMNAIMNWWCRWPPSKPGGESLPNALMQMAISRKEEEDGKG